ncbi:Uncharacterized protein Fot_06492 [Forsythia ovata]|uniref:Uncharacterized protein n=1 Tax=Forsythia ovata TaxID=205694 RepID=A0ABD1WW30_9LAMI
MLIVDSANVVPDSRWSYLHVTIRVISKEKLKKTNNTTHRGEPGPNKHNPVHPPRNHEIQHLLLMIGDLPCKRTCHGKGQDDKRRNRTHPLQLGPPSNLSLYIIRLLQKTFPSYFYT